MSSLFGGSGLGKFGIGSLLGGGGSKSSSGSKGAAGNLAQGNAAGGDIIPKGYSKGQLQNYTPEQMNLFQQLFSQVNPNSQLSQLAGGDTSSFEQLEAPAMQQFQGLLSDVGNRYSQFAPGAMSAQRGSGFKQQLGAETSNFAQQLASNRMALQRQAMQDLLGISQGLLGSSPTSQFLIQKEHKPSAWGQALGVGLPIAGAVAGGAFGGPAGAMIGGQVGSAAASGFHR